MKFFFRDQSANLQSSLPEYRARELSFQNSAALPQRTIKTRIPGTARNLLDCDLRFFFRYEIFPRNILKFFGEWQIEDREMRVGDVIVQQVQVPPTPVGLKFVFAARVLSIELNEQTAAFSYGTLPGHPETGTNKFSFSRIGSEVIGSITTTAGFASPVARLLASLFTQRYVNYCNRQALRKMKDEFHRHN